MQQRLHLESLRHVQDNSTAPAQPIPLAPATWTALGPFGISTPEGAQSGRVTAVVTDSRYPSVAYLAAAGGGIWRTDDAGNSWQSVGDNLLSMASGTLALDERIGPQGALYYGTGDFTGYTYGVGILRSTDGGATWTELSPQFEASGGQTLRIALHPTDPRTIFAARDSGVWRTTDGGASWANVLAGFASDVVVNPNDASMLFAALGYAYGDKANGVYRSTDGGTTWQLVNAIPSGFPVGRISLAMTPASAGTVVALIAASGDFSLTGLYRSDDFGASWKPLNITNLLFLSATYNYNRGWFAQMLTIDPTSAKNLYVGGELLYRSLDGGQSFAPVTLNAVGQRSIHEGMFGVAFQPGAPDSFYTATEGGIYRTTDGGRTWFNLNKSLPIAQIDAVAVSPGSSAILAAGESNGVMSLTGEFSIWTQLLRGNAGTAFFDPFSSGNVGGNIYAGQVTISPMRSIDNGATWTQISAGIAGNDPTGGQYYYAPFLADPNRPGNLLFGTTRVWRSTNQGSSWTAVSPQLATQFNNLTSIAVTPDTGRTYAGTNDGVLWYSANGAANWSKGGGLPGQYISTVAADPSSPLRAYLSVWGYASGHVFRTLDGGANWQDISGSLPNVPVNALAVDPRGPLYAATDIGVFRYSGGNWTSYNQGLPHTIVTSLSIDPQSNRLIAGTFGRGAFQITISAPSASSPSISAGGIVDAASYYTILSPGAGASIYGLNLIDDSGKTTVKVNGVTAILLAVSPGQVNFVVPAGLTASFATVTVTTANGSTGALVQLVPSAPGIYATAGVRHADGSYVSPESPAHVGETVVAACNGLGDLALNSLLTAAPVAATIGGVPATVAYAGAANWALGVFQVNVTVPTGVTGDVLLVLSSGSRFSNSVTIAVR